MRALLALAVMAVGVSSALPSLAQDKTNCADSANLTQSEMNHCAGLDYQAADDELNAVWAELRDRRGEGYSWDPILEAQRAWVPFRDAHCESVAAPYEGGSIQPLIRSSCLADVTEQRTAQLRDFLNEP